MTTVDQRPATTEASPRARALSDHVHNIANGFRSVTANEAAAAAYENGIWTGLRIATDHAGTRIDLAEKIGRLEQTLQRTLADSATRAAAKDKALDAVIAAKQRTQNGALPTDLDEAALDDLSDTLNNWFARHPDHWADGKLEDAALVVLGRAAVAALRVRAADARAIEPPF